MATTEEGQGPDGAEIENLGHKEKAVLKAALAGEERLETADLLDVTTQYISNIRTELVDRGYLEKEGRGDYSPTEKSRNIDLEPTPRDILGDRRFQVIQGAIRSDTQEEIAEKADYSGPASAYQAIKREVEKGFLRRPEKGEYRGGDTLVERLYKIDGLENPDIRSRVMDGIELVFGDTPGAEMGSAERDWSGLVSEIENRYSSGDSSSGKNLHDNLSDDSTSKTDLHEQLEDMKPGSLDPAEIRQKTVLEVLDSHGGSVPSQDEIIDEVGFPRIETINALMELEEEGVIEKESNGESFRISLNDISAINMTAEETGQVETEPELEETAVLADYILNSEKSAHKSKFMVSEIEERYGVKLSPNKLGSEFLKLADTLGLDGEEYREEFKFAYTHGTSWWLENIREEYSEELEQILDGTETEILDPPTAEEMLETVAQALSHEEIADIHESVLGPLRRPVPEKEERKEMIVSYLEDNSGYVDKQADFVEEFGWHGSVVSSTVQEMAEEDLIDYVFIGHEKRIELAGQDQTEPGEYEENKLGRIYTKDSTLRKDIDPDPVENTESREELQRIREKRRKAGRQTGSQSREDEISEHDIIAELEEEVDDQVV